MEKFLSKALLMLTLATGLAACGSSTTLTEAQVSKQIASLQRGMTSDEVMKLMGNPSDKFMLEGRETWKYERQTVLDNTFKIIEVGFINGRVEYINTYNQ